MDVWQDKNDQVICPALDRELDEVFLVNYLPNSYELEVDWEVVMVVPSQDLPHTQELFVSMVARWLLPDF